MGQRLDDIFEGDVFRRIRSQFPEVLNKVVVIEGDCTLPGLGLNMQNRKLLIDEVNIVFHVAATVRFDEKLKTAAITNIRSVRDLLRLAQQMPRLKSFVHVSTAYSNCIHEVIEERIYPSAVNYKALITMMEHLPEHIIDNISPRLINNYPNTYTFTKQIAEKVVEEEGAGLPIGIHRPAIVISTYKEPIRGWINNVYGLAGFLVGVGVGLLRVVNCDSNCLANIVPVDMCVNSIIATAWEVATTFQETKKEQSKYTIPIYTFESTNDNPLNWRSFANKTKKLSVLIPSGKTIWYYWYKSISSYPIYLVLRFLLHTIPAAVTDGVLLCIGKPVRMMKIYNKIHKLDKMLSKFSTRQWTFIAQNIPKLIGKMTERDKNIFFSDMKELDWDEFYKGYVGGARLYLLKEPLDNLPEAKIRFRRLYWIHQVTKILIGMLLLWMLWFILSLIFKFIV